MVWFNGLHLLLVIRKFEIERENIMGARTEVEVFVHVAASKEKPIKITFCTRNQEVERTMCS